MKDSTSLKPFWLVGMLTNWRLMGFPPSISADWTSGKLGAERRSSHGNGICPYHRSCTWRGLEADSKKSHKSTQKMMPT